MQRHVLQDAIFGARYTGYFCFRLRFLLIVSFLTLAIRGVEFYLIRGLFSSPLILQVVVMRLLVESLSGGWWGALETMRASIRGRYSFNQRSAINANISYWLLLSVMLALIIALVPMPYFLQKRALVSPEELHTYDLYLISFCLSAFLQFTVTTYKSGAFAIRRIYRPLRWMVGAALISLTLMLALWKVFGLIGLPIAFILGEMIEAAVQIYFIRSTYRDLHLTPLQKTTLQQFFEFILHLPCWKTIQSFVAALCLNLENFLVLYLSRELSNRPNLLIYCFILREIYRAYAHWGFIFYYDFKKMLSGPYPLFYEGFLKRLFPVSIIISAIFFFIALAFTWIFYPSFFWEYSWYVGIFFSLAAIFSFTQIHAFSQSRYADLVFSSVVAIGLFLLARSIPWTNFSHIYSLLAPLLFAIVFLWKERFPATCLINGIRKQSIYTFANSLAKSRTPSFQVLIIKTDPKHSYRQLDDFLNQIALKMDPRGWLCPLKANQFLLIEPTLYAQLSPSLLTERTLSFESVKAATPAKCQELLHSLVSAGIHNNPFYKTLKGSPTLNVDQLFHSQFEQSEINSMAHSNLIFDQTDKNAIYTSIENFFLRPLAPLRHASYAASLLLFPEPKIYLIKNTPNIFPKICFWNQLVHYLNFERGLSLQG